MKKAGLVAGIVVALTIGAAPASAKPGDLIVAEYDSGEVSRLSPDGSDIDVLSGDDDFEALSYLTFAPDGSLFVTANVANGDVFQVPEEGGNAASVGQFSSSLFPWGLDRAPDGRLLISDADERLWQLKPGGSPTVFALSPNLWGLDALPNRTTLATNPPVGILRFAANGDESVFAEDVDLDQAADVVRAPNGDVYVVTRQGDGHLVRIHDGAVQDLASGLGNVYGLALAPNGLVYTTSYDIPDAVNRVDPKTGDVSEVASAADGISGPIGIGVEPPKCKGKTATIVGSNKKDKLKGSKFKDVIASLKGKDTLKGGKGRDFICAGKSKDKVKAAERKPKRDKVNCGTGNDRAIVDEKDKVARNCEEVVVR
jgi:hypothetical protein